MKIIAICGSPRKGNTEFILKRILTKAEELGARTELILLREKRIEFCNGCLSCDSTGECNIRDDMQIIYPKLEEADLIIFGSPNYFNNMSGMMKNFIDRLLPFYYEDKLKDKKIVAVVVGASDKIEMIKKPIDCIEEVINLLKASFAGDFSLMEKDKVNDIENNPDDIKKIDEFTEGLIGQN
jgi:multimeric flavodoxin WrbA